VYDEYYEDEVTIGVYDDHAASAGLDELEYVYLCEECAEERGADVTSLSTIAAGLSECCDNCGRFNRAEEEEEYEEEEEEEE
jgi:hypothetical protein